MTSYWIQDEKEKIINGNEKRKGELKVKGKTILYYIMYNNCTIRDTNKRK